MSSEVWSYYSPGVVRMEGDFINNAPAYLVNDKVSPMIQEENEVDIEKYFIITDAEVVEGYTYLTLDGQGVYTLTNNPITFHQVSSWRTPVAGFPLSDPEYSSSDHTHPEYGDVSGPGSSGDGRFSIFDGETGKALKDSGYTLDNFLLCFRSGWAPVEETITYAGADDPVYTATISGDVTGKYTQGMRIRIVQASTTKYFIVVMSIYSSPNTTLYLLGGTDYDLTSDTITAASISPHKAPVGFPMDPAKWQVITTDTTDRTKATTTANAIYYTQWGSKNISVPIGVWRLKLKVSVETYDSAASTLAIAAMSTANNSISSNALAVNLGSYNLSDMEFPVYLESIAPINLTTKTTYYFVIKSISAMDGIYLNNSTATFVMAAECALL